MSLTLKKPPVLLWALGLFLVAIPVAYLPLPLVLAGAATATIGVALLHRPWLVWPGLGLALPFAAATKIGPVAGSDLLLALAAGLWFVDGTRRRTLRLGWFAPAGLGLLYATSLLITTLPALQLGEAAKEVLKWFELVLVLLLLPQMLTPRHVPWLVAGIIAGAVLQAGVGLYQFVFRVGPDWFIILGRFMRASGTFRQPNPFAGYLGLVLPVVVSLALWAWTQVGRTWHRPGNARIAKLALAAACSTAGVLIGLALLASWSRGGWLGAVAGVGTVLVFRSRKSVWLTACVSLVVLVPLLLGTAGGRIVPAPVAARFAEVPAYLGLTGVQNQPVTDENFSVVERLAHWVAAVRMWEQSPWFGIGPGNYPVVYPDVRLPRWEDPLGHAHNVYLNVLAESGLIGLSAFVTLWLGTAIWLLKRRRAAPTQSWENALALGVVGVVAHLSVHNIVDNLFVQGMVVLLALWMATVQIVTEPNTRRAREAACQPAPAPSRWE